MGFRLTSCHMATLIGPKQQFSQMSQNFCECIQMQSSTLFRVVALDVVGTDETCDVNFYGTWGLG